MHPIKHVTIVGGGVLGSQVAYRLLKQGHKVLLLDAGDLERGSAIGHGCNERTGDKRPYAQTPWGWHRRYSLQPQAKTGRGADPQDLMFDGVNLTTGPMLVSTKRQAVVDQWHQWLKRNPDSDAQVITPSEAVHDYELSDRYFGETKSDRKGGVFICDSRDCILDYTSLTSKLWKYMDNHPNCELHSNTKVDGIGFDPSNSIASHLVVNGEEVGVNQVLFAIGNQSSKILPIHPPVINVSIPYAFLKSPNRPNYKFAGLWNTESTLTCFEDGSTKLSCGLSSMISLKEQMTNWKSVVSSLPAFAGVIKKGISGLHIGWELPQKKVMNLAIAEVDRLGLLPLDVELMDNTSCGVDLTPSLCPYVDRLSYAQNVLLATGFSGSGSLALDPWFSEAVAYSLKNPKAEPPAVLRPFKIPKSLTQHWNPHPDLRSPISTMGSTD